MSFKGSLMNSKAFCISAPHGGPVLTINIPDEKMLSWWKGLSALSSISDVLHPTQHHYPVEVKAIFHSGYLPSQLPKLSPLVKHSTLIGYSVANRPVILSDGLLTKDYSSLPHLS